LLQIDEFRTMLSTISPNLLPRAVDQLWQCCGGSGTHGAIDSATLAAQLFAQEWRSAELHRAQAEAGSKTPTMASADATRAREEQRVRDDMAMISRLWDEVKDGAERIEQMENYLGDWQVVVRLQAWARGAIVRRQFLRQRSSRGSGLIVRDG
jgi:hypothetical protein